MHRSNMGGPDPPRWIKSLRRPFGRRRFSSFLLFSFLSSLFLFLPCCLATPSQPGDLIPAYFFSCPSTALLDSLSSLSLSSSLSRRLPYQHALPESGYVTSVHFSDLSPSWLPSIFSSFSTPHQPFSA